MKENHHIHNDSKNRKNVGFTMVEILIVMTVILLLGALMLPVVKNQIERMRAVKCIGNLKQFGLAVQIRAAEKGDIPTYKDWVTGQGLWRNMLAPYLPISRKVDSCPSEEETPYKGDYSGNFSAHYGWSYLASPSGAFNKVVQIASPSRLCIMADTKGSWYLIPSSREKLTKSEYYDCNFTFRHNGRANVLFLDGHVEALLPEDVPTTDEKPTVRFKEFWYGRSE